MAINVYGWRKPTLELELVEGGSLLANTKYYVIGFMRYNPHTYNSVGSPLSDLYTITTTSTARSIKITQKTYRDITAFASAGAGVTTVTSERHCLKTGDSIKIASGSYAGTWAITKVDANTFTIPTAYVDDVAVQCYTDSVYYNKPDAGNVYMMYYVDTLNPYDDNGTFLRRSRWLEQVYQYTYGGQNPVIVTAQPTGNGTTGTMNLKHSLFDNGVYKEVCDDYGLIYIEVIDDVVSLLNIHTAVQNSGFILNTHLTSISNNQQFTLIGSMTFSNTAELTVNSATLNYICSEVFHRNDAALLTYTGCLINLMPVSFTAQMLSTMNNCVFYNRGTSNNYQWIFGDDTIFYGLPRPYHGTNQCDIPNLKYNNLETGGQDKYGIIQNKIFRDTGQGQIFQTAYNYSKLINCTVPSVYWCSLYVTGCRPDIYMIENCTVNRRTYYTWHFRLYTNDDGSYYNHHFKYLNVNVDSADNNIKKCIHNYAVQEGTYLQADFYRRLKLYISNQSGEAIENATINITDNADNIYTGTTDASGYTYIDCLEQKTRFDGYNNSMATWNPTYDTYYSGFTITVDKEGYEQEIIKLDKLYQEGYYDKILNVSLNSNPQITNVNITNCSFIGSDEGEIEVNVELGKEPYEYSLDGIIYQSENIFTNLVAGEYSIYIKDANDNETNISGIKVSEPPYENNPKIDSIDVLDATDNDNYDGQIIINSSGVNTPITYSINGIDYQTSNVFSSLNSNLYTIYIKDSRDNIVSMSNVFVGYPQVLVNTLTTTEYVPLSDYIPAYEVDEGPDSLIYRRVIDAQGYRCPICGIRNVWNKQTLYFNWYYVDGNNKNKSIPNLRLICSNCKSQFK